MKYIDLHCDALSKEGAAAVSEDTLRRGGCLLQCFAVFSRARENRFARANEQIDRFHSLRFCHPVRRAEEVEEGAVNALLTLEGGGAFEGDIEKLGALYGRGVRMCTLVWNEPNELGFPCTTEGQEIGLTPFGRDAAEEMRALGMVIDVSHGSEKLFYDVAEGSRQSGVPFVASHSNAYAVHPVPRNLTDGQIKTLAECGGVVGLNFVAAFLGRDSSAAGQRAALLAHAEHILQAGGEDVLAIGSDFDGAPPNPYIPTAAEVPKLLHDFERAFGSRIAEKIAISNALRVFQTVLKGEFPQGD